MNINEGLDYPWPIHRYRLHTGSGGRGEVVVLWWGPEAGIWGSAQTLDDGPYIPLLVSSIHHLIVTAKQNLTTLF